MKKKYVLYNLKEAREELDRTISDIQEDPDYGDFVVAIQHLYHHINTAWNARDASEDETEQCSQENFKKWSQFPTDLDMFT